MKVETKRTVQKDNKPAYMRKNVHLFLHVTDTLVEVIPLDSSVLWYYQYQYHNHCFVVADLFVVFVLIQICLGYNQHLPYLK